jgi:hypothetical protein
LLLGCYRTGDANDPETYVAAIAATLARYSEGIITDITHPVTGLPARLSWLPTVKEVFDACEAEARKSAYQVARERRIREQLAEREADETAPRLTREQLQAKYGANWGMGDPTKNPEHVVQSAPGWKKITEMYSSDPSQLARLLRKDSDMTDLERHIDAGFSPSTAGE